MKPKNKVPATDVPANFDPCPHCLHNKKMKDIGPCDVCFYGPPSSGDGKPCCICPAISRWAGE